MDYPARTLVELGYIRDNFWLKDLLVLLKHIPVLLLGQAEDQLPLQTEITHKEASAGE